MVRERYADCRVVRWPDGSRTIYLPDGPYTVSEANLAAMVVDALAAYAVSERHVAILKRLTDPEEWAVAEVMVRNAAELARL